ncbi:MAG: hypothetical protein SFX73_32060 [Kofleriaceae bacterium]|nr:hypothetical protein [Kofleriaceae bacterium]
MAARDPNQENPMKKQLDNLMIKLSNPKNQRMLSLALGGAAMVTSLVVLRRPKIPAGAGE